MKIGLAGLVAGLALGLGASSFASPSLSGAHTYRLGLNDAVEVPALGGLRCLHAFSGGGRAFSCWRNGGRGYPPSNYMVWMRSQRIQITDRGPTTTVCAHRW
jgi:hypothetical protein